MEEKKIIKFYILSNSENDKVYIDWTKSNNLSIRMTKIKSTYKKYKSNIPGFYECPYYEILEYKEPKITHLEDFEFDSLDRVNERLIQWVSQYPTAINQFKPKTPKRNDPERQKVFFKNWYEKNKQYYKDYSEKKGKEYFQSVAKNFRERHPGYMNQYMRQYKQGSPIKLNPMPDIVIIE